MSLYGTQEFPAFKDYETPITINYLNGMNDRNVVQINISINGKNKMVAVAASELAGLLPEIEKSLAEADGQFYYDEEAQPAYYDGWWKMCYGEFYDLENMTNYEFRSAIRFGLGRRGFIGERTVETVEELMHIFHADLKEDLVRDIDLYLKKRKNPSFAPRWRDILAELKQ